MPSALATGIRDDGTFAVDLRMGTPPRPCPCVIHVAVVGTTTAGNKTPAQVDIPIEMPDQPTAPVPQVGTAPARLEVLDARLTGGNSVAAWFGGSVTRKLVYTVKNPGPEPLQNPPLQVTLGRSGDDGGLPTPATTSLGPGQTQTYEVPVEFPFAAFGRYDVKASLAGLGNATVTHHAYPWGLVLINIARRGAGDRRRRLPAAGCAGRVQAAVPTAAGGQLLLPAVVRIALARRAPGLRRRPGQLAAAATLRGADQQRRPGRTARPPRPGRPRRDRRHRGRRRGAPGGGGDEGSRAVIDLDALDGFLANRGALSWATPTQLFKVPKLRSAQRSGAGGSGRRKAGTVNLRKLDHLDRDPGRRRGRGRASSPSSAATPRCPAPSAARAAPGGVAAGPAPGVSQRRDQGGLRRHRPDGDQGTHRLHHRRHRRRQGPGQAIQDHINANGGIGGRKLEAIYRNYEASNDSPAEEEKLCNQITQDDKAFAVVLTGQFQSNARPCYAQRNTLVLDATLLASDQSTFDSLAPYLWSASFPVYDDFVGAFMTSLKAQGFFEGASTVGVVAVDNPGNRNVYASLVEPKLAEYGVTPTIGWVDTTDLGTLNMGTSQAALEFRTKGIKQVFFLGGARLAPFFMTSAAAQDYTARYAVSSFDNPTWMVANTATVPPEALKGMVGIGFNPGQDVPDSQYPFPSTDAERECVGIFAAAGISFETRENARVALTYCDSARLLKAAAAKISGDLNAATFSSAAQSLGN